MRSLSFRTAQILLLLAVLLLTATVFGVTSFRSSRFAVRDLSQQIIEQNSARIAEHTESILHMTVSQDRMAKNQLTNGTLPMDNPQRMNQYFLNSVQANLDLSYLSFTRQTDGSYWHTMRERDGTISMAYLMPDSEKGQLLREYSVNTNGTLTQRLLKAQPDREQRTRPYYLAAKDTGISIWTETYTFIGAEGMLDIPGISRATPVYTNDEFLGVLTADLDLYSLSSYLNRVPLGKSGYAFILEKRKDGNLRLIAHPNMALLTKVDVNGKITGVDVEEANDPIIDILTRTFNPDSTSEANTQLIEVAGENWFGAFRALEGQDMPQWIIGVVLPEKDMMGRIHGMNKRQVELVIYGVILTLLLGMFFARRVTRAIQNVTKDMEQIANFDIDEVGLAKNTAIISEIREMNRAVTTTKQALRSFGRYVPRRLVRNLMLSGKEATLGADRQIVSILFTDIAGFTPIVESTDPSIVLASLEEYFICMNEELKKSNGTVSQYMGDAIMAFWNAPLPQPDHAARACRSALAMRDNSRRLAQTALSKGLPSLPTRFGIETGDVMVGNIGADERFSYTCLGDTANTASRLEGLNKAYGSEIILGHKAVKEVDGMFVIRPLDKVKVKGKETGAMVYELIADISQSSPMIVQALEYYADGLADYFAGRFAPAMLAFEQCHTIFADEPSQVMADRCQTLLAEPPDFWDGIWVMKTK
jgi:adenylate cyclase